MMSIQISNANRDLKSAIALETSAPTVARKTPAISNQPISPTLTQLQAAVDRVAEAIQGKTSDLRFTIDQDTGKALVRITDTQTGEMIRQIPSVELVEIAKSLDRLQGLLFKQKA